MKRPLDQDDFEWIPEINWGTIGETPVNCVLENFLWIGDSDSLAHMSKEPPHWVISVCNPVELSDDMPIWLTQNNIDASRHVLCNVRDSPKQDMRVTFTRTYAVIAAAKQRNERVLVHCAAGMSRSAAVVLHYLIRSGVHDTLREAYMALHGARACIYPNLGFMRQLLQIKPER